MEDSMTAVTCPICGSNVEWGKASDIQFGDFYTDVQAEICPKCGIISVSKY